MEETLYRVSNRPPHRSTLPADMHFVPPTLYCRYTAVMLPYKGLQYAALAVLPDEGVTPTDALAAMRTGGGQVGVKRCVRCAEGSGSNGGGTRERGGRL